jgi:hypothetical protein
VSSEIRKFGIEPPGQLETFISYYCFAKLIVFSTCYINIGTHRRLNTGTFGLMLISIFIFLGGSLISCKDSGDSADSQITDSTVVTETGETGSTPPERIVESLNQTGFLEHLLPTGMAVDPGNGLGFSVSLSMPTLSVFDMNNGELLDVVDLEYQPAYPRISVDGQGTLWLSNSRNDAGFGYSPTTQEKIELPAGFAKTNDVLGLPGGGAVYVGVLADGSSVVRSLGGDAHQVAQSLYPDELLRTVVVAKDGIGVLAVSPDGSARVVVLGPGNLEEISVCDGLRGGSFMVQLPDESWVVSDTNTLFHSDCSGGTTSVTIGNENHQIFVINNEIVLLDRIGEPAVAGESWAVMRHLSLDLEVLPEIQRLGRNSGFGGYDPRLEQLWVNSEGTGEVWAIDVSTGEVNNRLRLGTHLDQMAIDPSQENIVWVTGRLSSSVVRVDLTSGERVYSNNEIDWPVGPVFAEGSLWVVDGLSSGLFQLDPETLTIERVVDLNLPENPLLAINDMAWSEARSTLFLTHGATNILYEVDPVAGEILSNWTLAGELITDTEQVGLLEIFIDGDFVYVARLFDGEITRIDPDVSGSAVTGRLADEELAELSGLSWDLLFVEGDSLFFGPFSFDTVGLRRTPENDIAATHIIGRGTHGRYGWSLDWGQLMLLNESGGASSGVDFTSDAGGVPNFVWAPWSTERLLHVGFGSPTLTAEVAFD